MDRTRANLRLLSKCHYHNISPLYYRVFIFHSSLTILWTVNFAPGGRSGRGGGSVRTLRVLAVCREIYRRFKIASPRQTLIADSGRPRSMGVAASLPRTGWERNRIRLGGTFSGTLQVLNHFLSCDKPDGNPLIVTHPCLRVTYLPSSSRGIMIKHCHYDWRKKNCYGAH